MVFSNKVVHIDALAMFLFSWKVKSFDFFGGSGGRSFFYTFVSVSAASPHPLPPTPYTCLSKQHELMLLELG